MSLITTIPLGFSNAILVQEKGTLLVDIGSPATVEKYRALFVNLQLDPQDIGLISPITVSPEKSFPLPGTAAIPCRCTERLINE